ncbi:dUTPase [Clostridium acetireducens DSM 10703]|jgi:dimeric dUTPase (all-alpha-NTP-PPase superfamily)|uniref:dUTPase n=1 Tax=Clostridium acetireducens DSM 10703 TaxID=1121290 RepID=A0A1E8EZQ3_9CLOT|nr:dUTP diphosphatase [Clostridium acetireducens]OFI06610.1 dUTPase [Clostridium acetireducens DSM 10703]
MNLKELFVLQKELDNHISKEHNLYNKNLLSKKILALQVELGELANETKCFKFWSNKKPSNKEIILEEYVDCLHFLLSIGLDKSFNDIEVINPKNESTYEMADYFLNLFVDINDFFVCSCKDQYITLFEDFLMLGNHLCFSEEDIKNAYIYRNKINHNRQINVY